MAEGITFLKKEIWCRIFAERRRILAPVLPFIEKPPSHGCDAAVF